ncbi:MAG: hypothetical protein WB586_21440 [Chthoniobacterales bacterium]
MNTEQASKTVMLAAELVVGQAKALIRERSLERLAGKQLSNFD